MRAEQVLSFLHDSIEPLPALAWLFVGRKCGKARLIHGRSVDVFANGFYEGCLAGDIDGDVTQIRNVFGSGMKIQDGKYVFITPSHTLESIFLYRHENGFSLSNSLSFLLEYHTLAVPWDARYGAKFASLVLGIEAYEKELLRTTEGKVLRFAYDNVVMDSEGRYELARKPLPPAFKTYAEYVGYLGETLRQAFADAGRGTRATTYRPLATCSTGYDSASAAAIARRLGCKEAITLTHARGGESDSGRAVGEALGLTMREFPRPEYAEAPLAEVAEFLATGMGGEDSWFREFAPVLGGRVLLTGFHGGAIWETHAKPNVLLARVDLSGSSLQEFRLWRNFIHIPVPMIGARRQVEVLAITHAAEMRPYRLHRNYDRPIPRRILEESGVPREMFGQRKKGGSILLFLDPHPLRGVAREEYKMLAAKERALWVRYWVPSMVWWLKLRAFGGLGRMERFLPWTRYAKQALLDWRVFEHSHPRTALHFCAGVASLRDRYRVALRELRAAGDC